MNSNAIEPEMLAAVSRRSAWSTGVAGVMVIGSLFASAIMIQETSQSLSDKKRELEQVDADVGRLRKQAQTLDYKRVELEHYNQKLERSLGVKAKRHARLREQNNMLLQSIQALSVRSVVPPIEVVTESPSTTTDSINLDSPSQWPTRPQLKSKIATGTKQKKSGFPKAAPKKSDLSLRLESDRENSQDSHVSQKTSAGSRNPSSDELRINDLRASADRIFRAKNKNSKNIYRFSIWFSAPSETREKIRQVSYFFDHPSFREGKMMRSDKSEDGYRVEYRGWVCLSKVVVQVDYKDGKTIKFDVDQCAAILLNEEFTTGS